MITCCSYLYFVLATVLIGPMVVHAAHSSLPTSKAHSIGGISARVSSSYDYMQTHIDNLTAGDGRKPPPSLQRQQSHAIHKWTKEFLAKREATPHSAPYVVSIQLMTEDEGLVHYCAGTIIDEHWILTAAHCLSSSMAVENSVIVAGCHDIHGGDLEAESVQLRNIDYYVQHELYLGGVNPYDIALIYTREPLQFGEFVQPAQLPEQDTMPTGYGTLYGWGNVSMTIVPQYPHRLQEANMPILDMELCEQVLAAQGFSLHETNLCTGPLSGGVSICTADSGGPLVQTCCDSDVFGDDGDAEEEFTSSTVIGIVSWGKMPCGQKNAPSVFVRVSAFSDWINQIIATATHSV